MRRQAAPRCSLREQLQLCFDCWNLLDAPGGISRRSDYLPPGLKEPDPSYRNRIENARPTGFFRDALRTYAGMLSFLEYLALPASLQRVISDVDGRGTDLALTVTPLNPPLRPQSTVGEWFTLHERGA